MLSGKEQYMELIWIIEKMFIENFGNDIKLVSMNECVNQMGYFRIQYKYIPLEYEIVFESERNLFCIDIYDKETTSTVMLVIFLLSETGCVAELLLRYSNEPQ